MSSTTVRLPTELLELIVPHTLPESFENFAVSSKHFHALCKPYIAHHNALRRQYRNFSYGLLDPPFPYPILTAVHLLVRIMEEPLVARYIKHANLRIDGWRFVDRDFPYDTELWEQNLDKVADFVQQHRHIAEANVNSTPYAAQVIDDAIALRYSQHAAAFLLTLLPNVERLQLPSHWQHDEDADRVIDTIIRQAQMPAHPGGDGKSLQNVVALHSSAGRSGRSTSFNWIDRFLVLPELQRFHASGLVYQGSYEACPINQSLPSQLGAKLTRISLVSCCLDGAAISSLLTNTASLKSLYYYHDPIGNNAQNWDLFKFISAIADRVGAHLEKLYVSFSAHTRLASASKLILRDRFVRLRTLEIPVILAQPLHDSTQDSGKTIRSPLLDLLPSSMRQISLVGTPAADDDGLGLQALQQEYTDTFLPNLEVIHLTCPAEANEKYKEQCAKLKARSNVDGIAIHTHAFHQSIGRSDD